MSSRDHMKIQRSAIFVKKSFKINIVKIKKYKARDHCHYTGEYCGATLSICNLKYSIPREITIFFQNGTKYDYHFIMKELAEEFVSRDNLLVQEKILKHT